MTEKSERVSREEFDALIRATEQALGIVVAVLAEASDARGIGPLLAAAIGASQKIRPNPLRDRLLLEGLRAVLVKGRHKHPDDQVLQALCEIWLPKQTKH